MVYESIYPGIDLRVYSNEAFLKYYFVIDQFANPEFISLSFDGYDDLNVFNNNIVLRTGSQLLVIPTPLAYQIDSNNIVTRLPWQPNYVLESGGRIRILPGGTYDSTKKLVYQIGEKVSGNSTSNQRNLEWSTYFGGSSSFDEYWDIETNLSGQVYITGYSNSTDFPVTPGASQINNAGETDIVVCKFDNNLKLLWSTYHGGSKGDGDIKHGITVDNLGNAYIAASTYSSDVPLKKITSNNAYYDATNTCQSTTNTCRDILLAKYNTNGVLQWATYFGGYGSYPSITDIFIDNMNNLYITGKEGDNGMPYTYLNGAYYSSSSSAFIARFNASLALDWCTGFGNQVYPSSIIKGNDGKIYIAGTADEGNLPTQASSTAYNQQFAGGGWDGFISRFGTSLNLEWSTYFGGSGNDWFYRLNADQDPNNLTISLIGNTNSNNFPVTSNSGYAQTTYAGPNDLYVDGDLCMIQFNSSGGLEYSSYYGGIGSESGYGITTYFGQKFYAGVTKSSDFPLISSANHSNTLYYNDQFYNSGGGSMACIVGFDKFTDRKWTTFYGGETDLGAFNGATIHSLKFSSPYLYFTGFTQAVNLLPSNSPQGGYNSSNISGGIIGRFKMTSTVLSVSEISQKDDNYGLYPNPTNGLFKISNNQDIDFLKVINVVGQEVITIKKPASELDFTNLSDGIYLLEISTKNKENYYVKLIKN